MRSLLLLSIALLCLGTVSAQDKSGQQRNATLLMLEGFSFPVYYSEGQAARAQEMAGLCAKAMNFMDSILHFRPTLELKVLAAKDWSAHTGFPVYGMPHPLDEKILVLAAEDNPFWQSFIPDMSQLPPELAEQVRAAYATNDTLSMQPFFDLLVVHELAHLYHLQQPVKFGRAWLSELFANVFLHTFIAEKEPARLAALTAFPRMVVARGSEEFHFTTLQELEADYALIANEHPKNYGWYQCKWHSAAANIYDQGGITALSNYWNCFAVPRETMDDAALTILLQTKVHSSVAEVLTNW